jgi:DivIVA domain-containing protein
MPLNPEEVVNKRFSPTKFRQGYDEEEVDEFLDEVVAELRRLNAENDELRSKLRACEGRVSELSRTASTPDAGATSAPAVAAAAAPVAEPAPPAEEPAAAGQPAAAAHPAQDGPSAPAEAAQAPAAEAPAAQAPAAQAPAAQAPESAAGMLALAQRLHDEYVQAGKDESAKLVGEAQEQATRLVREAEERQRRTLGELEQQRQVLQRKVEELRSFEREYRARLKAYLENQLRDLEAKAPVVGRAPDAGSAGAGADGGQAAASAGQETPRLPFGS